MRTILLGTAGNQPFDIKVPGVSRQHAKIIIDDDDVWTIEDLGSSNGTYLREEDGNLRRVDKAIIEPMSFICLGPHNSNGCSFYAKRVLGEKGYSKEFMYLNEMEDEFEEADDQIEKKTKRAKLLPILLSVVVVVFSWGYDFENMKTQMIILRITAIVSPIISYFFDANNEKKKLQKKRQKFYTCPNPQCSHIMSVSEVRDMRCLKCKAQ